MKYKPYTLSLILLFVLSGCSSIQVTSDYDKKTDFSKYSTFNFKKPEQLPNNYPTVINPINQKRIESAVMEEMSHRSYMMSSNPDLIVSYYLKVENKVDYQTTTYGGSPWATPYYGPSYYGYYSGYGHSFSDTRRVDYQVGTLIIDIVDAKRNELIWFGTASKVLNTNNPDPEKTINEAVTKIFYEYPFLAGQREPVRK